MTQPSSLPMPRADDSARRMRVAIPIAFFFSGAAALFYQVIWLRQLATVFGNTTLAISVTLTSFMSGLALGSYVFGRIGDRVARPFRLYAWLEIMIGVYGLASLSILYAVHAGYIALATRLPYDSFWLVAFHFAGSLLALLTPTALMGGTLPVASKGIIRRLEAVGPEIGKLYGINTLGAAVGVVLVGFFLLPILGLRVAVTLAACINLGVGALVLWLDALTAARDARSARMLRTEPPEGASLPPGGQADVPPRSELPLPPLAILIVGFGLSGFAGLALEVVWTRALTLYIGSSVYAFSAILLAVLTGIAVGSLVIARVAARREIDATWFAGVQFGAGISTLGMAFFYNALAFVFLHLIVRFSASFSTLLTLEVLVIVGCLLLPTLFSGAAFPVLSRLYVRQPAKVARGIGLLYAANTVGCIAGSFAAGFLLIPHIGLRATVLLCAGFYTITAAAVLLFEREWDRVAGVAVLGGFAVCVMLMPPWQPGYMSAGFFRRWYEDAEQAEAWMQTCRNPLFYREGSLATVAVIQAPKTMSLLINAKPEASDVSEEMDTQTMIAHLPLLLAERADSVLVIGLGSGTTCGTAALHPVRSIKCIEIEPAVAAAARYFGHINHNVLNDPRFHLVFADARNYLAAGRERYDVIISEPSNPWFGGVASLFTIEHFTALRDSLSDDGIICQWVQLYEMSPSDFMSVVATFAKVFPDAIMWWSDRSHVDVALLARKHPWKVDFARFDERMRERPQIMPDFTRAGFAQPISALAWLMMGPDDLRRMGADGQFNTDNLPLLEFSAPRSLYLDYTSENNERACAKYKAQPLSEILDLGPAAADADMRSALAMSFAEHHPPEVQADLYLPWMREEYAAAVALAPQRMDLRAALADVEKRIRQRAASRRR